MKNHFAPFTKETDSLNFKSSTRSNFPRVIILPAAIALFFLILFARLFQLTIVKGAFYKASAQDNRIKEIPIEPERGTLRDRNGVIIAHSVNTAEENKLPKWQRQYRQDLTYSHILGYLQTASKEDIDTDLCDSHLALGDRVGKNGLEKIFECPLRGRAGKQLIEVQASGIKVKVLNVLPAKKGLNITTSIDSRLQEVASAIVSKNIPKNLVGLDLPNKKIAIIATIPSTGEILLMASFPSFSLSAFEKNDTAITQNYFSNDDKPLFNRVAAGTYPPGSTFKPIVAAAALEEGKIDENFTIEDTGTIKAGPLTFGNWYFKEYGRLEGTVNIVKALKRSNDIFFYKVGEKLGAPDLKLWAARFGLGRPTGSSLSESDGLLPSAFWKQQAIGERWFLGDTYNLAIGQGYLLTTPLQLHTAIASFASGGKLCVPKLLKQTSVEAGHPLLKKELKTQCKNIGLSAKTISLVREGMRKACETGGTGWPFFNFAIPVGCKTGTAEHPGGAPHAWFTVFAPFDKPEIALTVMVENAGEGSNVAAPIAKEILKVYFENK